MNGVAVVQPGTVLAIQKTGILGVPLANLAVCTARYQSGELHAPTGICPTVAKAFSNTDPPSYFKSQVTFEFAKGFLEAATFAQVQSEISHVFASPDNNAGATPAQQPDPAPTSAPA